jgi:hypothetical protein
VSSGVWDDDGKAFRGVHIEAWREAFYAKHTGDSADAKKKAFQRIRKDMADARRMKVQDDVYLSTDPTIQTDVMLRRDKRDNLKNVPMQKPNEAGQTGQMSKTCPVSRPGLGNYPTLKEIGGTCPADTKVLSQNAFSLGSGSIN